jgi:hypothetical protein
LYPIDQGFNVQLPIAGLLPLEVQAEGRLPFDTVGQLLFAIKQCPPNTTDPSILQELQSKLTMEVCATAVDGNASTACFSDLIDL